jgi:hypothetical protein
MRGGADSGHGGAAPYRISACAAAGAGLCLVSLSLCVESNGLNGVSRYEEQKMKVFGGRGCKVR